MDWTQVAQAFVAGTSVGVSLSLCKWLGETGSIVQGSLLDTNTI